MVSNGRKLPLQKRGRQMSHVTKISLKILYISNINLSSAKIEVKEILWSSGCVNPGPKFKHQIFFFEASPTQPPRVNRSRNEFPELPWSNNTAKSYLPGSLPHLLLHVMSRPSPQAQRFHVLVHVNFSYHLLWIPSFSSRILLNTMPSYTLNNWDGSFSNPQDQISSQREEKQASSSATIHSRATPDAPQKVEKSLANGKIARNKDRYQAGGVESSGLNVRAPFYIFSFVAHSVLI